MDTRTINPLDPLQSTGSVYRPVAFAAHLMMQRNQFSRANERCLVA